MFEPINQHKYYTIFFSKTLFYPRRKPVFKPKPSLPYNKKNPAFTGFFTFAVRAGFEPAVRVTPYVSLANWWFQPLTHLTKRGCKYNDLICHLSTRILIF